MDARHVTTHPIRGLRVPQRTDADDHEGLVGDAEIFSRLQEVAQQRQVVAVLRLHELRAVSDFLGQTCSAMGYWRHVRVFCGAQKHLRCGGELAATLEAHLIAHGARNAQQTGAIEVVHRRGLRMVACLHAVARQAQHVADTHGGAAQDVALNGDAVLVAAGDLHYGCVTDTR